MKTFLRAFIVTAMLVCFPLKANAADITNNWSTTTQLPYLLASHVAYSLGNKPYILGGSASTGNSHNDIISSIPNASGAINSWFSTSVFPTAPIFHSVTFTSNKVYILGGREENPGSINDFVGKVFMGNVDSGGNLTGWTAQNSLPNNLGLGAAAISGNRIYFSGGFNDSTVSKKVYTAPINPDGSLGVWTEAGEMPEGRLGHGMIEHNGNLIILGGSANGPAFDTVYKASVNPDGTISSWSSLPSLPEPLYRASFVKAGGQILAIGGYNAGLGSRDTVYYTTVHNNGTIDPWQLSVNHLPANVHGAAATVAGGYLYLAGGFRTQTDQYLDSVYVTKLNISNDITLSVPLIKQTDPLWKDLEYDSAHLWASPSAITIGRWGCALTSAVMIFQYHGITKLPDGGNLTPDSLNSWLKNEKDGYVGNGLVNWIALSRLSKLAKTQNPSFSFDALQYKKDGTFSAQLLTQDLQNNIPNILEEHGHYIVAKGTLGNSFFINDPYYARTSLADYSNTAISRRRFIPSHTDLSYMMFLVDQSVSIELFDQDNNSIGDSFIQDTISDPLGSGNSGNPMKTILLPVPADGNYTMKITSNTSQKYFLQGYLYDVDGNVKIFEKNDVLSQNDSDTFSFNFSKNGNTNTVLQEQVTFTTLRNDLSALYGLGFIKKDFYKDLKEEIDEIEKSYNKGKDVKKKLKELLKEIKEEKKLNQQASSILINDIQALINTL